MFKNILNWLVQEKQIIFNYLVIGFSSVIIYFSLFALCWELLGINYKLSITITYVIAVLFHFTANRYFTFKAHGINLFQHATKYAAMIAINYIVTLVTMFFIVESLNLIPYIGIMLAIAINVNTNFLISRFWVFRNKIIKI